MNSKHQKIFGFGCLILFIVIGLWVSFIDKQRRDYDPDRINMTIYLRCQAATASREAAAACWQLKTGNY